MFDYLVIGSGFAGAVIAERIASQLNKNVLIVERRSHLAGNAFDFIDTHGVLVHRYGPHLFHTNSTRVWDYLSQFTEWTPYEHRVLAEVDGLLVPVPFNFKSIDLSFTKSRGLQFKERLIYRYGPGANIPILKLKETDDDTLKPLAQFVYDKVFYGYTKKQWGLGPDELDPSVTARVPVRVSYDDRYFQDFYQAMPKAGYTEMFKRILSSPRIELRLNTDYRAVGTQQFKRIIYTGPIDEFFDYRFGPLPYRSLNFEFIHYGFDRYQQVGQVNFPNSHEYTRIAEFKQITGQRVPGTTIEREYPLEHVPNVNEPYYPMPVKKARDIYDRYLAEALRLKGRFIFVGRLAEYRYYNMDQVVARALSVFEKELTEPTGTVAQQSS
jgi:UDP-galactopyranose mutase